ncbi:MAG: polysaccharide biosynthesis tyrosine autokinase [Deltaproteobacteria bacterium]|nr:polysaccharide biosynthesis tyrosine autokinase [Deltaproteobacteria bacterium]
MQENQKANLFEEAHLLDYWRVIMKRRKLILTTLLVVLAVVIVYVFSAVPIYRGTTQLLIERANPNLLSPQEIFAIDPSGQDFYQTQYRILESRAISREVIRRMNLDGHPLYKPSDDAGFSLFSPASWFSSGEPARSLSSSPDEREAALVSTFQTGLAIKPVRNSRIVEISFDSPDPKLAAGAANTLAQAYIDWNLGIRIKSTQSASTFLDEQVKQAKQKMEASEQALQQYREKYGLSVMATKGQGHQASEDITRQRLRQVNTQLTEATNRRIEAEIKYRKATELLRNPDASDSIPEVVMNPIIISMKDKEIQLIRERTEKSSKYGSKHPVMVALNEELDNLRTLKRQEIVNIVNALKANYEVASRQEGSLMSAMRHSEGETINRDKVTIQFQVLEQEAESNRQLYDLLLKRLKETSVTEENRTVNIHVVDAAEVPRTPVKPKKAQGLLLALVVGLGLGTGAAFFSEYMDDTVKNPEDLEKFAALPYLGSIPRFETDEKGHATPDLMVLNNPKSPVSEAYRGLRTGILFSAPDQSPKIILVTSAAASEGKTLTCANTAMVMAFAGDRTLMVDLDMRRPRLHKTLNLKNDQGLSNILVGDGDWRTMIQGTSVENLSFISSGPIAPNPAELIASTRMQSLIEEWKASYDRIIIDSPPVSAVTDAVLLARLVDGTVIVTHAGVTSRHVVASAVKQIRDAQGRVLGAILNDIDTRDDNYYYHYHYYHHYYYGEAGQKKKKKKRPKT